MSSNKHEFQIRIDALMSLINLNDETFPISKLSSLAEKIVITFKSKRRLAFVGNGGSAAEAMHLAAEFTGKCVKDHIPLNALCLNESQSALTAIANDYGLNEMYSRIVSANLQANDILIALSTSGKSSNILEALERAKEIGVHCYLWTGKNDIFVEGVEVWKVPSSETPRIQEIHLVWGHLLAEVIELEF